MDDYYIKSEKSGKASPTVYSDYMGIVRYEDSTTKQDWIKVALGRYNLRPDFHEKIGNVKLVKVTVKYND